MGCSVFPDLVAARGLATASRATAADLSSGGTANPKLVNALMHGEVVRRMLLFIWHRCGVCSEGVYLGERITAGRIVTLGLSRVGATLVLGSDADLTAAFKSTDLLALASGFFYAMQNVASRKADVVPTETKAAAVFFGGGVLAGLLMLAFNLTVSPIGPMRWLGFCLDGDRDVDHHVWRDAFSGPFGVLLVAELVVAR